MELTAHEKTIFPNCIHTYIHTYIITEYYDPAGFVARSGTHNSYSPARRRG